MHILFLQANNPWFFYFNWFAERSKQTKDVKISFAAIYYTRPRMLDDIEKFQCDCYWIPSSLKNKKLNYIWQIIKVYRLIKKIKPDVVHTHLFEDSFVGLIAARLAGIKIRVVTKQDTGFHWYYMPKMVRFDRVNNRNATHIVAVSEEGKDFILNYEKAAHRKVHMIHHGTPKQKCTNQIEEVKKDFIERFHLTGKRVVGVVSKYIEWKGHLYIVEAAEMIVKRYPDTVFLFTGWGKESGDIMDLINSKNLNNHIIISEFIPEEQMPSFYGVLDVFVHAAIYEPFGFVIAEAMMNGVPVVSTKTGAAADAIQHLETGYLVPYRDSKAIAEGVNYMFENETTELRKKAKEKAIQMYDFDVMYGNYINLYKNAIKNVSQ